MKDLDDEMLMAYVDGELDGPTRAAIAAAIARDPEMAERAERYAQSAAAAKAAFADLLNAQPPDRLVAAIKTGPIPLQRRAPRARSSQALLPLAASVMLAIGLGAGYFWGQSGAGPIQGGLLSGGPEIASLLATTPAGEPRTIAVADQGGEVTVTGSYRVDAGLCRSFTVALPESSINGVGCDRGAGFGVEMMVSGPPSGGFGLASDAATQSIDAFLGSIRAGAPLSAAEEAEMLGL